MLMKKIFRSMKRGELRKLVYLLALTLGIIALVPRLGEAAVIPAGETQGQASRVENEAKIKAFLERKEVAARLGDYGLTPEEVASRLDRLTDQQVADFAAELDKVNAGGDAADALVTVLVIILLVLLILWLLGYVDLKLPAKKKALK